MSCKSWLLLPSPLSKFETLAFLGDFGRFSIKVSIECTRSVTNFRLGDRFSRGLRSKPLGRVTEPSQRLA
jgi:hypothetical protein